MESPSSHAATSSFKQPIQGRLDQYFPLQGRLDQYFPLKKTLDHGWRTSSFGRVPIQSLPTKLLRELGGLHQFKYISISLTQAGRTHLLHQAYQPTILLWLCPGPSPADARRRSTAHRCFRYPREAPAAAPHDGAAPGFAGTNTFAGCRVPFRNAVRFEKRTPDVSQESCSVETNQKVHA